MVTFKRYAGSLQLDLRTFDDVLAALTVPKTQWVATACPIDALSCDARFLAFLDSDANGRVRVEEFTAAVEWTAAMLEDTTGCDEGESTLEFARLSADGAKLREAALLVLEAQGEASRTAITLAQVQTSDEALRKAHFNGDGIVARESVVDPRVADVVKTLIELVPETKNRTGHVGVTREQLEAVRARLATAREHHAKRGEVYAWGEASEARAAVVQAARAKVDEYFLQCRLVAAQPDATARLHVSGDAVTASLGDPPALARAAASAPIAPPDPAGTLAWAALVRGAHYEALTALRTQVFEPVYGAVERMTEEQWRALASRADAIDAWKAVTGTDQALYERYATLAAVTDDEYATIVRLADEDLARKERLDAVAQLEKLILYQHWLLRFANNFVSMLELYDPARTALFERGRMILAGRLFTFSVLVTDRPQHVALATRGTMYIAYVKISPKEGSAASFEVAVPVTYGTAAGVEVGKRGIFIDVHGVEWDATVLQVITNPVSLWEAILAPYKRIGAFVSSKVETWAGQGDRDLEEQLNRGYATTHDAAGNVVAGAPPAAPPAAAPAAATTAGAGANGNVAIALSIAIAAVSGVISAVAGIFAGKSVFQILGMLLGLFMAVSVPAGVFAWLKLRKRDMAIVLEACGWALNDRMRLGRYLGALFTRTPSRPVGSKIETLDAVRVTIERRRAEGLDEVEPTGLRWWAWVLIVVGGLLMASYPWRIELCDFAAARGHVNPGFCHVLAGPGPHPVVVAPVPH